MRSFFQAVQVVIMALSIALSLLLPCAMAQGPDIEAFLAGVSQNPILFTCDS